MAESASTLLKAIEDCVRGNKWTDSDEAFQELRRTTRKGGQNVIDMAASAEVILEFLAAFTNRRKIYKRQVVAVVGVFMEHDAWRTALARAPAQLQEDIERLRADDTSKPSASPGGSAEQAAAQAAEMAASRAAAAAAVASAPSSAERAASASPAPEAAGADAASAPAAATGPPANQESGSVEQPVAQAADGAKVDASAAAAATTTPANAEKATSASAAAAGTKGAQAESSGWAPEWKPAGDAKDRTAPSEGVSRAGDADGPSDELHDIVAAIVKSSGDMKCEKEADEVFSDFRCICEKAKSTPGIFDQEKARSTDVLLFVLKIATRKRFKLNQACEVLTWLHEAPGWCTAMECSPAQVQESAKDAMLPNEMLPWFGLTTEETEENPVLTEDLPLASALAERRISEENLGISSEASLPSAPRSSPKGMTGSDHAEAEAAKSTAQASADAPSEQASKAAGAPAAAATVDTAKAAKASAATPAAADAKASTSTPSRTAAAPKAGGAAVRAAGADSAAGLGGRAGTASAVADAESAADSADGTGRAKSTGSAGATGSAGVEEEARSKSAPGPSAGADRIAGEAADRALGKAPGMAASAAGRAAGAAGMVAGLATGMSDAMADVMARGIQATTTASASRTGMGSRSGDASVKKVQAKGASMEHTSSEFMVTSECELQPMNGDFSWVRRGNGRVERQLRAEAASWTLLVSQKECYAKQVAATEKVRVRLQHVQAMKTGTQLVRCRDSVPASQEGKGAAWFRHEPGQLVPVATEKAKLGKKVVAVNAANAYHAGGGFLTGGRHALEEALCMQSTLFQSLLVAEKIALAKGVVAPESATRNSRPGQVWHCHIPEDGVILSPHVEFFRGGSDNGYPFWSDAVALRAVVSVAMPNCNPRMRDCPVDAPADDGEYLAVLRHKFTAVCKACALSGARVLVLPDVGCGVFSNNPKDVGQAFGEVLRDHFPRAFDEIHIVGLQAFAEAAESFSRNGENSGSDFL